MSLKTIGFLYDYRFRSYSVSMTLFSFKHLTMVSTSHTEKKALPNRKLNPLAYIPRAKRFLIEVYLYGVLVTKVLLRRENNGFI